MRRCMRVLFVSGVVACAPKPGDSDEVSWDDPAGGTSFAYSGVVVINEVMADNESTVHGPDGASLPDWVELLNASGEPIGLDRIRMESEGGVWRGPQGQLLMPGERRVVWFDDVRGGDGLWTGFRLGKTEDFVLVHVDGEASDFVEIRTLGEDVSLARTPDGVGDFEHTAWPTPGEVNLPEASPTLDPGDATLFVTDVMHVVRFEMDEEAITAFDQTHRPLVHAEAVIDGIRYPDVALGSKGAYSYDKLSGKPAFKVVLNEWVPGTRFRGQRAFALHNGRGLDPTRTHEHLAYALAREAGLMAPRVGWAEVWVNGEHLGLYVLVERFEEEFIEYRRPGQGETGFVFEGNEAEDGGASYDFGGWPDEPRFDQEEGPRPPPMEVMASLARIDAIIKANPGVPDPAEMAELWTLIDRPKFLAYMAWETVASHFDGYKIPNNWRFYVSPIDYRVEWMPSGADWTWDHSTTAFGFKGSVAALCIRSPTCVRDYALELLTMADRVEQMDLAGSFRSLSSWLEPYIEADPRYSAPISLDEARTRTLERVVDNPKAVRDAVYRTFPELEP